MTDYMTATRALDEVGGGVGWTPEKKIEVLLGFIESRGLDAEFLSWAIAVTWEILEGGSAIVPATVVGVREIRFKEKPARVDTGEPAYILFEMNEGEDEGLEELELWAGPLSEFVDRNADSLGEDDEAKLRALELGQSFVFGGGAQPRFRLKRVT